MRLWPSILIVTLIVIVGFLTLFLRTSEAPSIETVVSPRILTAAYASEYEDNGYLFSGTARVPNRCLSVEVSGVYDAADNVITISLSNAPDEGICLEIETDVAFEIFVEAPEGAIAKFTANGEPVVATLLP